jgi:YHS domain-containing protein
MAGYHEIKNNYISISDDDIETSTPSNKITKIGTVLTLLCIGTVAVISTNQKNTINNKSNSLIEAEIVEKSTDPNYCIETTAPVLGGYDVVAYFSLDEDDDAVLGSSDYSYQFNKYNFYFENEKNMKKFIKKPEDYLPRFGAFCAYGISSEDFWTWDSVKSGGPMADPNVWLIRDEKLYLFMYKVPKRKFLIGNVDERISKGIEIWNSFTGDGNMAEYFNTQCFWWDEECGRDGDYCISEFEAMLAQEKHLEEQIKLLN